VDHDDPDKVRRSDAETDAHGTTRLVEEAPDVVSRGAHARETIDRDEDAPLDLRL
jgi:hypothetical protein